MKYLNLPKPHGFLIWRGKQTSIASDKPLLSGEKMLITSDGEAYGEAILGQPAIMNLSRFEDEERYHCVRPEDRKLYWPDADKFYVYRFKQWQPYEEFVEDEKGHWDRNGEISYVKRVLPRTPFQLDGDEAEIVSLPALTDEQQKLLEQVERLPKTLVLLDEAVRLEDGKAVYCDGLDCSKLDPVLKATLDGAKSADSLPLYQLALVRIPRLAFKALTQDTEKKSEVSDLFNLRAPSRGFNLRNESEKAMPYSKVKRDDEWCVINTDTEEVKKCYSDEAEADDYLAALNINEGKSLKELIAEARKCYDDGMPMPVMYGGPTSFAELESLEEAREIANETQELTWQFQMLSSNILNSPDISDKAKALATLANEYGIKVNEAMQQGGTKADNSEVLEGEPVEQERMLTEDDLKVGKRVRGAMMAKVRQAWQTLKEFMDWAEPQDDLDMMTKAIGIKMVNGKPWFIAYSANAFEDREKEIFSTKSLEQYVSEAEKKSDRGFFNFWHIPGSDFAEKQWQAVPGKFLIEAGPFLDNELGQAALKFFSEHPDGHPDIAPEGWGCSVEYRYLPEERKSGVYENVWITRTSALPRMAAANVYTKGTIMAVTEPQEKAGKTLFGEDLYAKLVKPAEAQTKELEGEGVASKEVTTETTTTTEESTIEVPIAEIADEVVKRIDLASIGEALTLIGQQIVEMQGEIKSLKQTEAIKADTETPRMVWSFVQRASESQKTAVTEDDPLANKKPVETQAKTTGAAAFFPAR